MKMRLEKNFFSKHSQVSFEFKQYWVMNMAGSYVKLIVCWVDNEEMDDLL